MAQKQQVTSELELTIDSDTFVDAIEAVDMSYHESQARFGEDEARFMSASPGRELASVVRFGSDAEGVETYTANNFTVGIEHGKFTNAVGSVPGVAELSGLSERNRVKLDGGPVSARLSVLAADSVEVLEIKDSIYDACTVEYTVDSDDLHDAVTAGGIIDAEGACVKSIATNSFVGVRREDDTNEVSFEFDSAEIQEFDGTAGSALFGWSLFSQLVSAIPKGVTVHVMTGEDHPLIVRYELPEDGSGIRAEQMVAPRIDG